MSPEQARGEALDARTDLFSLGVVLYEMATGRHAFAGSTPALIFDAILHKAPTAPVRLNPEVPPELERIIHRLLEKDRDLRYQSAADLRSELKRAKRDSDSERSTTREDAPDAAPRSGTSVRPPRPGADGGQKRGSRLSPDGERVAYSWTGPQDDNWDIYVKEPGVGARPLRVTDDPRDDWGPVWSPDGRQLAFVREQDERGAIYTVSSLGGQERKLIDLRGPVRTRFDFVPVLSWSPDGRWLAFAEKPSKGEPSRIVRLSRDTLEKRVVTSPSDATLGDYYPSFSTDGTLMASMRSASSILGEQDLWIQPVEGGAARRVTFGQYGNWTATAWTHDGREIVFTADGSMLRVRVAGGEPKPVPGVGAGVTLGSIGGTRMVFEEWSSPGGDIWRVPGPAARLSDRPPQKIVASTRSDGSPDYSPNGKRIAFSSSRSGTSEVWVCAADGSNPVQLTAYEEATSGAPRWSPDGRWLAFDSNEAGDWNVYVVDPDGGVPRRVTPGASNENHPAWSSDGRWLYFSSRRSGSDQIWKIPPGGGSAVQVTRNGGFKAVDSWDGKDLYYSKADPSGLWRMPVAGGEETELVHDPDLDPRSLVRSRSGVFFATRRQILQGRTEEYAIQLFGFESGKVTELFRKKGSFMLFSGLAVSPDEEWLLYTGAPAATSELMLVENFR
jgi:eukaryotic-like serine/threonine-protein kinase